MPDPIVHIISNVILALVITLYDKDVNFLTLLFVLISSNLIDIDHFLANPVYDPARCSITSHVLHKWYMLPLTFIGMLATEKYVRYFLAGVFLHLILDSRYCFPL